MPEIVPLELTEEERDGTWTKSAWDYRSTMERANLIFLLTQQLAKLPLQHGEIASLR